MKIFKKLLPLFVIVAILTALLVTPASPTQAAVSSIGVSLSDSRASQTGVSYRVWFNINTALSAGASDTITVVFSTGTDLSGIGADATKVRTGLVGGALTQPSAVSTSGTTLTATIGADIPVGPVIIKIDNVTNPGAGNNRRVQAYTSKETDSVLSETYNIPGVAEINNVSLSNTTAAATGVTYNFQFRLENIIFEGGNVFVTFPSDTDLTSVGTSDCTLVDTTCTAVDTGTRKVTFQVQTTKKLNQMAWYSIQIADVTNTTTSGNKTLSVSTSIYDGGNKDYLVTGRPIYVKTTGNDSNDGLSWANAKLTIGAAITAAGVGSTINVGYGTYTENVVMDKAGLTLAGNYPAAGGSATTTRATINPVANTDTAVQITVDNAVLSYFTVSGASGTDGTGIQLNNASNSQIRDCIITSNYYGIKLTGTSNNNRILGCEITSNNPYGVHASSSGQSNMVQYSTIAGNTTYGIYNTNTDPSKSVDAPMNWWGNVSGPDGPRVNTWGNPTGILGEGDKVSENVWAMPWLTRNKTIVTDDAIAYFGISTYADQGWNIISSPISLDDTVSEDNSGNSYAANTWGGIQDLGKREILYTGAHTGSNNASVLTDASASWTSDDLIGCRIYNVTDGSSVIITDNDATTVTGTLAGGTDNDWDTSDAYRIEDMYALKLYYTVTTSGRVYSPVIYWDWDSGSSQMIWKQATASTQMNPVDGFYVRMKVADSIPILFSPKKSVPSKYLRQGWNLVGYSYMPLGGPGKSGVSSSIETALKTIEQVPTSAGDQRGYAQVVSPPMNQFPWIYIPPVTGGAGGTFIAPEFDGPAGQEAQQCVMVVGRGYWVFMLNPGYLAGLTFTPMSFRMDY